MGLAHALVLALGLWHGGSTADRVELKNGNRLQGRVVYEGPELLVLRSGNRDREIEMRQVAEVDSRARHVREGIERWRAIYSRDVRKTLDLASFFARVELEQEADLLRWLVLTVDADDEEAHAALGHARSEGRWTTRDEHGREIALDELFLLRAQWKSAWEIPSEHFRLRTNLPLADAVTLALDLEGIYRSFYDFLGERLRLYEITEPIPVHVHATADSFPGKRPGRRVDREGLAGTLHVDASAGLDRGLVFREAVRELLAATARRGRAASGDLPAWLAEGLAEYVRHATTGLPARATFREGRFEKQPFERLAGAPEALDLGALLALSPSDFERSEDPELPLALAYTFVHFCLHGDGGAHRERFDRYLLGVWRGPQALPDLAQALGAGLPALAKAWAEHVGAVAGR